MSSVSNTLSTGETELGELSFWQSLMIQKRVVGALLMREILTRYGRHNIGFMWLFAEPMIFTIGVTLIWSTFKLHGGHDYTIASYALTGYSTVLVWRNMPSRCVGAILPNASLMFHRQVKAIDVYLSRIILETIGATISLVIISIIFLILGQIEFPQNYMTAILAWSLLIWFSLSIALIIGPLSEKSELVDKIWHPAMYFMMPLSGVMFNVESLPIFARKLLLINPIVHCVELFREGFYGINYKWHYSILYVITVNMFMTLIGLIITRIISKKIIIES